MEKVLRGIRGAVCTENEGGDITRNVCAMCREIFSRNGLSPSDIVSVVFSMTGDLDALNAARALRSGDAGIDTSSLALFTVQEAETQGSLEKTVRVLVTAYMDGDKAPFHSYLNGAEVLRPGFANK